MRFAACTVALLLLGPPHRPHLAAAFAPPRPSYGSKAKVKSGRLESRLNAVEDCSETVGAEGADRQRGRWTIASGLLGGATANLHATRALAEGTVGLAGAIATGLLSDGDAAGGATADIPKEAVIELTSSAAGAASVVTDQAPPVPPQTSPPSAITTVSVEKESAPTVGTMLDEMTAQKIEGAKDKVQDVQGKAVELTAELAPSNEAKVGRGTLPDPSLVAVPVAVIAGVVAAASSMLGNYMNGGSDDDGAAADDDGGGTEWRYDKPVPYGLQEGTPDYAMPPGMGGPPAQEEAVVPKAKAAGAKEAEIETAVAAATAALTPTSKTSPASSEPAVPQKAKAAGAVLTGGTATSPPKADGGISMAKLMKGSAAKTENKEWKFEQPTPYGLQDNLPTYVMPSSLKQKRPSAAAREGVREFPVTKGQAGTGTKASSSSSSLSSEPALPTKAAAAALTGRPATSPPKADGGISMANVMKGTSGTSTSGSGGLDAAKTGVPVKKGWKFQGGGGGTPAKGTERGGPGVGAAATAAKDGTIVGSGGWSASLPKGSVKGGAAKKSFAKSKWGGTGTGGGMMKGGAAAFGGGARDDGSGATKGETSAPGTPAGFGSIAATPEAAGMGPVTGMGSGPGGGAGGGMLKGQAAGGSPKSYSKSSFKGSPPSGKAPGGFQPSLPGVASGAGGGTATTPRPKMDSASTSSAPTSPSFVPGSSPGMLKGQASAGSEGSSSKRAAKSYAKGSFAPFGGGGGMVKGKSAAGDGKSSLSQGFGKGGMAKGQGAAGVAPPSSVGGAGPGGSGGGMLKGKSSAGPTKGFASMKSSYAKMGSANSKGSGGGMLKGKSGPSSGGFLADLEQASVPVNGQASPPTASVATAPSVAAEVPLPKATPPSLEQPALPITPRPPQSASPSPASTPASANDTVGFAQRTQSERVIPPSIGQFSGRLARDTVRGFSGSLGNANLGSATSPGNRSQNPRVVDGRSAAGASEAAGKVAEEKKSPPLTVTIIDPRTGKTRTISASSNANS